MAAPLTVGRKVLIVLGAVEVEKANGGHHRRIAIEAYYAKEVELKLRTNCNVVAASREEGQLVQAGTQKHQSLVAVADVPESQSGMLGTREPCAIR